MMNSRNERKDSRFKSYLEETDLENISLNDFQKTKLLDGETLVHEAPNVLMYTPLSDRKKSISGFLTVTTFKLSFISTNKDNEELYRPNTLLGPNDVCLSTIDTIYQVGDRSKKKLTPGQNLSSKVKELLIICKNMRVLSFSFKNADKDHGRNIANALLHHAYAKKHHLLFAYENKEPDYKRIIKDLRYYVSSDDWRKELERTKSKGWRISDVNNSFDTSQHLAPFLVVPKTLLDSDISRTSRHFRNGGVAVWVWGTEEAALVRMSELLPTITDQSQENYLLGQVHKSHPRLKQPEIMVLTKDCPLAKDIQSSYLKLRELCIPTDSVRIFGAKDFKFYSLLENSKWLQHVGTCLYKSVEGAQFLTDKITVVLQEDKGQDLNCVISSLIQILLDPHWRTLKGFQCLIQKEWIAAGHPFAFRLGHILDSEVEPSPVFLLFLDCVWQLLEQFPTEFQFTETYLTTIWDSAHITVFDTFLFNSEHDRRTATCGHHAIILRSVWDWNEQFSDNDQIFFNNPLYNKTSETKRIEPKCNQSSLNIWRQCYFRWLPDLEIRNGGRPLVDIFNRFLTEEIEFFRHKFRDNNLRYKTKDDNLQMFKHVNSFYPFSSNYNFASVNNELLSGDALDNQSILNLE